MTQTSSLSVPLTTKGLSLQVRITGLRTFRVRTWVAAQILRLAAWVIGLDMELSIIPPGPASRPSLAIPPARLAVADLDRADRPVTWQEATTIQVMLDNVEMRDVVAYDTEAGTVERIEHDREGNAFARDGKVATEVLSGEVTVRYREPA